MNIPLKVDLTNCDIELIHIPGLVQQHGMLIAVNPASLFIEKVSEDIAHPGFKCNYPLPKQQPA